MNDERFKALAAAYGGAISRWPVAERGAARWLALLNPERTKDILSEARRFDRLLDLSAIPDLGPGSREALIEGARSIGKTGQVKRSRFGAMAGAGLAAACAAGIAAGFVIAPLTTTDSLASPMDPADVAAIALGNPADLGDG